MNLNEDTEFRNVINILKQLQEVKAPEDFDTDLLRRINSEKNLIKKTLWQNIFIPSRLIPAATLVLTAFLLIFILNNSDITQENPFSIMPPERHDLALVTETNKIAPVEKKVAPVEKNIVSDRVSAPTSTLELPKEGAKHNEPVEQTVDEINPVVPSVSGSASDNKAIKDNFIKTDTTNIPAGNIGQPIEKAGLNFRQVKLSEEQKMEVNQLKAKMGLKSKAKIK